jgi:hypothetical protein
MSLAPIRKNSPRNPPPLIAPQELARRNNESTLSATPRRRTKSALLNRAHDGKATNLRPLRAIGFFNTDRGTGIHDHRE